MNCVKNMKKIIIVAVVFLTVVSCFSQAKTSNETDLLVSYQMDFNKFLKSDVKLTVNTVLIVTNQGSLFTFEQMMNLFKIQEERELTDAEVLLNNSPFEFLIKNNNDSSEHYEEIGNDCYKFKEKINHDWKLTNQDSLIAGYSCKKATLNYVGRQWTAWYTNEIPVSFGPYKFNGLPGLILKIKDSESTFDFTVNEIKTGEFNIELPIENFFIKEAAKPFENIASSDFFQIRTKFNQMSLDQKLQYMNRENEAKLNFVIEGTNGEKPRINRQPKIRNFIERFE